MVSPASSMASGSNFKTPPQGSERIPLNHGTASIAKYQVDTAVDGIKENVAEDLPKTGECEIETMLQAMLRIIVQKTNDSTENQQWAEAALQQCLDAAGDFLKQSHNDYTKDLRSGIRAYCDATTEGDRCTGTVSTLNAIICHFRSESGQQALPTELRVPKEELSAIFEVNDIRDPLRASNLCKPDIIQLNWRTARMLNGDEHAHDSFEDTILLAHTKLKPTEQTDSKLKWNDVLMTFQLKQKSSLKEKVIPAVFENRRLTYQNTFYPLELPKSGFEFDTSSTPHPSLASLTITSSSLATGSTSSTTSSVAMGSSSQTYSSDSRKRKSDQVASEESDSKRLRKAAQALHPMVQSEAYAAERLSTGAWIKCAIGIILLDDVLYLMTYDRQSPLTARGFDFIANLPHFVVLSLILQRLQSCHWDTLAFPSTPEVQFALEEQLATITIDGREFQFKTADASTLHVLYERGTTGVPVTEVKKLGTQETEDRLFLKMSWPETVRRRESEIFEKIREVSKEHPQIINHTPNLLVFATLTVHSTSNIRRLLRLKSTDKDHSRVLCCAVFKRLSPITDLKGMSFWKAYWEIIDTHRILWSKGIEHCDISVSNLMYRMCGDTPKGVLNDYDLARLCTSDGRQGHCENDRTGTIPFMAIDLLSPEAQKEPVPHLYRHDLESFAWVLFWVLTFYDKGKAVSPVPRFFEDWTVSAETAYVQKFSFLFRAEWEPQKSWKMVRGAGRIIKIFWEDFYQKNARKISLEYAEQDISMGDLEQDMEDLKQDMEDVEQDIEDLEQDTTSLGRDKDDQGDMVAGKGEQDDMQLLQELLAFLETTYKGRPSGKTVLKDLPARLSL